MELNGEVAIDAPRERVWEALNDASVLQACIPGCEEVVDESPTVRKARVAVKVGPVRARFTGKVTLSEVRPPERCVMGFEGSGGAAGMASGQSQVELHEAGGVTRLTYTVRAAVGGKLGQIGGRMIDASAKQLADQFFTALRAHVTAPASVQQTLEQPRAAQAPQSAATDAASAVAPATAAMALTAVSRREPASAAAVASITDGARVLWFTLGAATMGIGIWLGKVLF